MLMVLLAATARIEQKFDGVAGLFGLFRNVRGLKQVTSTPLSCPTRLVIRSLSLPPHSRLFTRPATNTPLLTQFGMAKKAPSGDQDSRLNQLRLGESMNGSVIVRMRRQSAVFQIRTLRSSLCQRPFRGQPGLSV